MRTYDLSVIFLRDQGNLWELLKRGEELVKRLRAGADFATLARANSQHYSAARGGRVQGLTDFGLAQMVQSNARFRKTLDRLKDGETSDAFVAQCYDPERLTFIQTGVMIVRRDRTVPPKQQPFEAVEPLVRGRYLERNYSEMVRQVERQVLDSIDWKIHFDKLPAL